MPLPAKRATARGSAKRLRSSAPLTERASPSSSTSFGLSSPSSSSPFTPTWPSSFSPSASVSHSPSSFLASHEAPTSSYIDAHTRSRRTKSGRRKLDGLTPSLLPLHLSIQQDAELWPPPATLPLLTRRASLASSLLSSHRHLFPTWALHLKQGSSVLLSGFGSKKRLLTTFAREFLSDGPVVVVNGYCPGLSARHLLSALSAQVMSSAQVYRDTAQQLSDVVHFFSSPLSQSSIPHVYLLVHSLDGPALRSPALQSLIAQLSALPSLHLVATVDAARCPLLWDPSTTALLRFAHWRVDTWQPYEAEVRAAGLALLEEEVGRGARGGAGEGGRGIREVVQSLTPRHRQILHVLATLFIQRTQARLAVTSRDEGEEKEGAEVGVVTQGEEEAVSVSRSLLLSSAEVAEACEAAMVGKGEAGLKHMMEELTDHQLVRAVYPQGKGGPLYYTIPQPIDLVRSFYLEGGADAGLALPTPAPVSAVASATLPRAGGKRGRGRGGGRRGGASKRKVEAVEEEGQREEVDSAEEEDGLEEGFGVYRVPVQPAHVSEEEDEAFDL